MMNAGNDLPQPPELPASAADPLPGSVDQMVEISTIAGGLAHEIRNSLSTLRVNLQLLDEDYRPDPGQEEDDVSRRSRQRVGTLLKESRRLETILDDFLQFVKDQELNLETCNLNELVGELADFYRPQAESHSVSLELEPADPPMSCAVDVGLFKQALLNLMINAQQAMTDGGQLAIRISAESSTTARIDIIDNGPGIAADQIARIFQAYYSTKKRGSGLGLATTRRIVRAHKGRIHVHSEPPRGTCFTILLPRVSSVM